MLYTEKSLNLVHGKNGPHLEVIATDFADEEKYSELIDQFEMYLEETDNIELRNNYMEHSPPSKYRLFALSIGNDKVEYSFSKFHPLQTIINDLRTLKNGQGRKS